MTQCLEISDLKHVYPGGIEALGGVSLRIGPGVFGLLGPNGAGKTTLMEILALRKKPTSGQARMGQVDLIRRPAAFRPKLGYLPQSFDFFARLRVKGALRIFGRLFGFSRDEARRKADAVIERLRLSSLANRPIGALSVGERRRFGIAQAILNDPELLIGDEPTAGLDTEERALFQDLIFELGQDRIVLFSTHIVGDIEAACEKVAVLHGGKVIFNGNLESLTSQANGKTWEFESQPEMFDRLAAEGRLTWVRELKGGFVARAVGDTPPAPNARSVAPGLEDAYIGLVGREAIERES
jgi:ABC-type multidrug transport system ATPase subunit